MGTMTRPFDETLGLMESAARSIITNELGIEVTDNFGMSELVTTAGNAAATFVDDSIMVRAYTEDSGTTVEIAVYNFHSAYAVSLNDTDEEEESDAQPVESQIVDEPAEGCGCGCHQ